MVRISDSLKVFISIREQIWWNVFLPRKCQEWFFEAVWKIDVYDEGLRVRNRRNEVPVIVSFMPVAHFRQWHSMFRYDHDDGRLPSQTWSRNLRFLRRIIEWHHAPTHRANGIPQANFETWYRGEQQSTIPNVSPRHIGISPREILRWRNCFLSLTFREFIEWENYEHFFKKSRFSLCKRWKSALPGRLRVLPRFSHLKCSARGQGLNATRPYSLPSMSAKCATTPLYMTDSVVSLIAQWTMMTNWSRLDRSYSFPVRRAPRALGRPGDNSPDMRIVSCKRDARLQLEVNHIEPYLQISDQYRGHSGTWIRYDDQR
jgi:hypothetical protein